MWTMNSNDADEKLLDLKLKIKEHKIVNLFQDILDDKFLVGFLVGKKGNVQKAFDCLEQFIHVRTKKHKNFTSTYRPSKLIMLDKGLFNLLKNKDPHGRLVVVTQVNTWFPSIAPLEDAMATAICIVDEAIRSYLSEGMNELVIVIDCNEYCFEHAKKVTPWIIRLALDLFLKSLPARPKALHMVNEGMLVHNIVRVTKTFLTKKLRDRIHLHSDRLDSLYQHLPPAILPVTLGGQLSLEDAYEDIIPPRILENEEFYEKLSALNY